ncbi:MAG: MurR/RpiR family transcriptional regulator [Inquilinus sp.]|nr:MurR/RpiR family transcriptional regulator [Inquilinus sp.]
MEKRLTPAETYEDLRAQISARHGALSRRLQQIAEFALQHPNEMALETVAAIAERAQVHPSSLIRFGNAFGFDGFSDMQRVFRSRLVDRVPSYGERIKSLRTAKVGGAAEALDSFVEAGIRALEHLRDETRPDSLERAIDVLARAQIIHVVAQRRAFPVAAYLAYALGQLDRRNHLLDNLGGMLAEQARAMAPGDALIAVSYKPYAPETLEVVKRAHGAGIPIIAITDNPLSPLMPLASVAFEVEESKVEAFRSLTASLCLAMSLVVGLGQALERRPKRRLRKGAA